ncbi:MAG: hypothetical protein AAF639_39405 [Chloroflexota bacterium]
MNANQLGKTQTQSQYLSFLFRLWLETSSTSMSTSTSTSSSEPTAPTWRCSVTHIQTGEKHGFATFAEAIRFMEERMVFSDGVTG